MCVMSSRAQSAKFKQRVADFDKTTRPVARQVLGLASSGVAQLGSALKAAQSNVDDIADAAVRLAAAHADLVSDAQAGPKKTSRARRKRG
jgi:hypothetical protein